MVGAVNAQFPPCNICDDGEVIGSPDAILQAGLAGFLPEEITCGEVDGTEEFNIIQCNLLRLSGADATCNCEAAGQTPVATPTEPAPVEPAPTPAPVTPAPTDAPVVAVDPTAAPVIEVAPTATPVIEVVPTGTWFFVIFHCCFYIHSLSLF